jgi:ABC-type Mn2+/Zn2+ transport system ATPase subunit
MTEEGDWIGAKWWKFDFHSHTPASDDYGKGPNHQQIRGISEKDWLLGYMRAGIDCVAITDHNSGDWIDRLKISLSQLEQDNNPDFRPLFLFPGVEISVQGNIHILGLFSNNVTTANIDGLLGAVRYRGTKGRSDACTECAAVDVISEIITRGGIAIPAHADINRGLFECFNGVTLEQVLKQNKILAIEMINPTYEKPGLYTEMKLNWSEVIGSDSHHPSNHDGCAGPGSAYTWVKMAKPTIDGLNLALIDGIFSIRRSDTDRSDPNLHGSMLIEEINVKNAKYIGRGNQFICYFNPWLNTIIGGRGTGKSTIIEFIRLVLKRKNEIPESIKNEYSKYFLAYQDREDSGLLTDQSEISINYRKDNTLYRISWSSTSDNHIIEEKKDGSWAISEGDIGQRFPVRIFSQKQIFELAKHPQGLLTVVNDAPEVQYRAWKLKMDELVSTYLTTQSRARAILTELNEEMNVRGELNDVERKIEVFEEAGHAEILKAYARRMDQLKAIGAWEEIWRINIAQINTLIDKFVLPEINNVAFSAEDEGENELIKHISRYNGEFSEIVTSLRHVVDAIQTIQKDWLDKKKDLTIMSSIESNIHDYETLLSTLSQQGIEGPTEYSNLVTKRQELLEKIKEYKGKREHLNDLEKESNEWLKKIYDHRLEITKLRINFLEETLHGNPYVRINVIPFGNKETIEEEFRTLINKSGGVFERDIGTIDGNSGLLSHLNQKQNINPGEGVETIKKKILLIFEQKPGYLNSVIDPRFATHVQSLLPEQIDRLQCWFPGDSLFVEYSMKDNNEFKPIDQGSPGQKTAALLAFTLSYGKEPLVLDQPEDDLDNNLIYDLIVAQLKEKKESRQIFIVTHNANIVVNGDSENVIALDVKSGQTKVIAQGCLQEQSIRDEICQIMEGGKEAFKNRYMRINGLK